LCLSPSCVSLQENPEPDRASIYHSVIINTSKEMMCYSDFPIPAHFPNFMHNTLIMDYYRMYADHFQLTKNIRFNVRMHCQLHTSLTCASDLFSRRFCLSVSQTHVLNIKKRSDFSRSGQWDVETENKDGRREKHIFDAVMICIGHHCQPNLPLHDFPGEKRLNSRFNHSLYNLKPKHRLFSQHPTVNDELPNRILSGTVQVKPNIRRFHGSNVEHSLTTFLCVFKVFATGYNFSFPFLASNVVPVSENQTSLYKYVFPPELDRPTLAIIGLVQPLGAIMPISEMQARWATRVFKGRKKHFNCLLFCCIKLPSSAAMQRDINSKQEAMAKRYVSSQRHTIQVDYINYMDEIADLVGVRPRISRLLLTDPRLGLNLLLGPCTPYQYRLRGPGKWAGARQAIFTQWDRVAQPMQTRPCNEPEPLRSLKWPLLLSAAVAGLTAYYYKNSLLVFLQDPAALLDMMKSWLPTH
ncbi:hypothetical protein XENOCAPTIV_029960, partial [Xenoophorus captivus]